MVIIDKNKYAESQLAHWCKMGYLSKDGSNYTIRNRDIVEISRAFDNSVFVETTSKLMFFI